MLARAFSSEPIARAVLDAKMRGAGVTLLFDRACAKDPACDLHLFAETDHFMFSESNTRVRTVIYDWLDKYFPVQARAAAA